MICYRDRCYCSRKDCGNTLCTSRLTEEVERAAEKAELPIDMADLSKDGRCYVKKTEL